MLKMGRFHEEAVRACQHGFALRARGYEGPIPWPTSNRTVMDIADIVDACPMGIEEARKEMYRQANETGTNAG